MAKIVFFCIPAHGHTNPTLQVVRELTSRGHQVWYYSYEMFREKIEATGATFVGCDAFDMEKKLSDMQYDYEKQQDMAEEIRRIQEQIRALKHDMKNHTLVMLSYLEENKTEEAKAYGLIDEVVVSR